MMRSSIRKAFCLAAGVVLLVPIGAAAQSILFTDKDIVVSDASGISGAWQNGDTLTVGGSMGGGFLQLVASAASGNGLTVFLNGVTGDAFFGAGDRDGDIILRDTDGTTTTIELEGSGGFIQLGSIDEDGDLRLYDDDPDNSQSIDLDGGSGNVSQQFAGNGLVKAWARINSFGTVASCYNCDMSAAATNSFGTGLYEVSFSPLGTDIRSRPRLATLDSHSGDVLDGQITLANRDDDNTSVFVRTSNSGGTKADMAFTIFIF